MKRRDFIKGLLAAPAAKLPRLPALVSKVARPAATAAALSRLNDSWSKFSDVQKALAAAAKAFEQSGGGHAR